MEWPDKFFLVIFSFLAGIFTASFFKFSLFFFLIFLILLLAIFLWAFILKKKKIYFWLFLFFSYFLGMIFYQIDDSFQKKSSSLNLNNQGNLVVKVLVDEEPELKGENFFLKAKILEGGQGRILIKTRTANFAYGDLLLLKGEFQEPENFSDFDYRGYLAKEGIYSVVNYPQIKIIKRDQGSFIKSFLFKMKKSFEKRIDELFPDPEASFLKGLLFGEKTSFSPEFKEHLQKSGASHLVALSGYNVTIIIQAILFLLLFLGLSRRFSFWLAIIFIISFILMTGASASVVRAGLMGILVILSQFFGRLYFARNALFASLFLMTCFNPKILRFDPAFQLSFSATLGLIYLFPFYQKIFQAQKSSFFNWRENLAVTFSAQTAVLPLLIIHFGYLSLISPLVNLLLLIFIPLIMSLGFFVVFLSFIFPFLALVLAWPVYLLLKYETSLINFFGGLSFSAISFGRFKELFFWLTLLFLIIFFFFIRRKKYAFF